MKIFLVEDDENCIKLIKIFLRKAEFESKLMVANNGNQAFSIIENYSQQAANRSLLPDVILLDLNLPGIDGLDLLKHIKRSALTKAIPVIVTTSHLGQIPLSESYRWGAASVLYKPIDCNEFIAVIKCCLNTMLVCFKCL